MIPNANGGLHVGLGVEPTVSYSSEEKVKMLISVFWIIRKTFIIYGGIILDIIRNIIADYEKIVKTSIQIPLNDGDKIQFSFQPQDLPHLLGLQHLVDNPILFEYSQNRLSASELYKRMCGNGEDAINPDEFEESEYFEGIYNTRIKYFSSELLLDIIQTRQIVKFDPSRIKHFTSKLDKIEYLFWKRYKDKDNNYGYFGVGFMFTGKKSDINYPNTFFFRLDSDYIRDQKGVLPCSIMKKDKEGVITFEIYWEQVWQGMKKNPHYKKLKKLYAMESGVLNVEAIESSIDADMKTHYELLQLDALDKIYLPYMKEDFRWTNEEKRYILKMTKNTSVDLKPNEVKQLLNEYRQKEKIMRSKQIP